MDNEYGVFLGLDVGKGEHHAIGLDPAGKQLHNAALPNSEPKLREVFGKLASHGRILVVVDQPATIGALTVTVAPACGHGVAYEPKARNTTPPSSASPDAAATSCSPCSETRPATNHPHPERLDDKQTPQKHVPLTTVSGIEHGGDGFDLHKLIVVAEHCYAHQGAGDVVVTERVPDYLPGCHQVLPAG